MSLPDFPGLALDPGRPRLDPTPRDRADIEALIDARLDWGEILDLLDGYRAAGLLEPRQYARLIGALMEVVADLIALEEDPA